MLTPVDRRGKLGLRTIIKPARLKLWISEHARELVDAGYRRLLVRPWMEGQKTR